MDPLITLLGPGKRVRTSIIPRSLTIALKERARRKARPFSFYATLKCDTMNTMREKSNLLAVDVVVLDKDKRVLLRTRTKDPDNGKWELFGGYPYLDELPLETAARRILQEKAGIEHVTSLKRVNLYYDNPDRHPGSSCVPLVYVAIVDSGIQLPDGLAWFSLGELETLPIALDNKRILLDTIYI